MLGRRTQNNSTPASTPTGTLETLIGKRTEFSGDITFNGGLRVDGKITGNVSASGSSETSLVISETGQVQGNVDVSNVVINGTVNGNVVSSGKVELQASARVNGDVHYRVIEMALGSAVNGSMVRATEPINHGSRISSDGKTVKS